MNLSPRLSIFSGKALFLFPEKNRHVSIQLLSSRRSHLPPPSPSKTTPDRREPVRAKVPLLLQAFPYPYSKSCRAPQTARFTFLSLKKKTMQNKYSFCGKQRAIPLFLVLLRTIFEKRNNSTNSATDQYSLSFSPLLYFSKQFFPRTKDQNKALQQLTAQFHPRFYAFFQLLQHY